jgi:hypothetical protein
MNKYEKLLQSIGQQQQQQHSPHAADELNPEMPRVV